MKKLSLIMSGLALVAFTSCDKEMSSEDISRVTNFPTFEVQGEDLILHQEGTPYADPGVAATEGGNTIPVDKSAVGVFRAGSVSEVDENKADHYVVSYSAKNKDGFTGEVTRDVWVAKTGDLTTSIEGLYTATVVRNGSSGAQYTDMKYILIWKNTDGTFGISDAIGGYYDVGRGYGIRYISPGMTITANDIATNDFSYSNPVTVTTFGGVAVMKDMMVDAAAKTITFTTDWDAGPYAFVVTLKQVQF